MYWGVTMELVYWMDSVVNGRITGYKVQRGREAMTCLVRLIVKLRQEGYEPRETWVLMNVSVYVRCHW